MEILETPLDLPLVCITGPYLGNLNRGGMDTTCPGSAYNTSGLVNACIVLLVRIVRRQAPQMPHGSYSHALSSV